MTFIAAKKVSIVFGTNKHVKSEMLSNRHTHTDTHTDTQTKYCNPRCTCAPRVNDVRLVQNSNNGSSSNSFTRRNIARDGSRHFSTIKMNS